MSDLTARFDRLVRPVLTDLYAFARRLTGDPVAAEDLLQQALLRGFDHLPQLTDDGAFRVWQSRVIYTTFLNGRARRTDVPQEAATSGDDVIPLHGRADRPDRALEQRRVGDAVSDALAGLPKDQREAVWLVDGQGFAFGEAAGVLGVPPGTVASRVARGRLALRVALSTVAADEGVGR
jgi:RNA polymerase sigma-70 factor (ECF subfamily)